MASPAADPAQGEHPDAQRPGQNPTSTAAERFEAAYRHVRGEGHGEEKAPIAARDSQLGMVKVVTSRIAATITDGGEQAAENQKEGKRRHDLDRMTRVPERNRPIPMMIRGS